MHTVKLGILDVDGVDVVAVLVVAASAVDQEAVVEQVAATEELDGLFLDVKEAAPRRRK